MPKTASKPVQVTVRIERGPLSLAQKAGWRKFWQKLIAEVKSECQN